MGVPAKAAVLDRQREHLRIWQGGRKAFEPAGMVVKEAGRQCPDPQVAIRSRQAVMSPFQTIVERHQTPPVKHQQPVLFRAEQNAARTQRQNCRYGTASIGGKNLPEARPVERKQSLAASCDE